MGVLTLKGPVNCEDLRHETVPPNWPQDTGSPGECELSRGNWAETGSHKPPLHSSRQQSRLKDLAPACQRETRPFCGYSLGSDLHLNLPSLSQLLCFRHILGAHLKSAEYVMTL